MIQIGALGHDPKRKGFYYCSKKIGTASIENTFLNYSEILEKLPEEERFNIFYTAAHHTGAREATYPVRTKASFERQEIIAWDIDHVTTNRAFEYLAIVAEFLEAPKESLILICSGNGLQVLANLKTHITKVNYFEDNKPAYNLICEKLNSLLSKAGLPGECDPVVFDPARILRLPGSINRKPNIPDTECRLLQNSTAVLDLDLERVSGIDKIKKENVSPKEILRNYPTPDFQEAVNECGFIKWAATKPEEIHEPHLHDLFSLLTRYEPGSQAQCNGKTTSPRSLAEDIFAAASSPEAASKSLARSDFDSKWRDAPKYGARKCDTIGSKWDGCKSCPHFGRIPTPLALKGREHIGSEKNGYWVLGSKGEHKHPAYSDLDKMFSDQYSNVCDKSERILIFNGTFFEPMRDNTAKKWLEDTVIPNDPVRETHRVEFIKKVKVSGDLNGTKESELFEKSISGKLNCRNGTLDFITGELKPHSSSVGFKYCLGYDYDPHAVSVYFLEWLSIICDHRVDLIECILDMMAYCLWPTYDDHIFFYLTGGGNNGKSTLIHILQNMVGKINYTTLNMKQLGDNRFAPADLEGKLMNLSEETSGSHLTFEHTNILKALSSGGEIHAERKFEPGFVFKNTAKMIFSANETPTFPEAGKAIKRRLLAIPFDYEIKIADSRIEDKLISEIPGILPLLVKRIQENVQKNGRFIVHRGDSVTEEAQTKMLMSGNNVWTWAKERVVSSYEVPEDEYMILDEAYANYREWAGDSGFSYIENKMKFSKFLHSHILVNGEDISFRKMLGKNKVMAYKHTRLLKENENET